MAMIYFIHDKTSGMIKIGFAKHPHKRLRTLQTATSNDLVLLGAIAGMKRIEKLVHLVRGPHSSLRHQADGYT
jgi:hypothetical protein